MRYVNAHFMFCCDLVIFDTGTLQISQEELNFPIRYPDLTRDLTHDDYPPRIMLSFLPKEASSATADSCVLQVHGVSEKLQLVIALSKMQKPVFFQTSRMCT